MSSLKKFSIPVEGMTCSACVRRVEKIVSKFDGVEGVSVNYANEKVSFSAPEDTDLSAIKSTVGEYGYDMVLQEQKEDSDTNNSHNKAYDDLKQALLFSLIFTIPVFIISMTYDYEFFRSVWTLNRDYTNKVLLILTTPVVFVSGKRFFVIFWNNLKKFSAEMNTLVAVGTGSAYIYSVLATLFPNEFVSDGTTPYVYFETSAVIITLILFGRTLEARAKKKTGDAINELVKLKPRKAIKIVDGKEIFVSVEDLEANDNVRVKPGDKIPADGIVVSGNSAVDESMITGESIPNEKSTDSKVIGGTINVNGSFIFRVTATGENSMLFNIIKLVEEAQGSKVPIQRLADKIASVFTPAVIVTALITFIGWYFFAGDHSLTAALSKFVAVLIVACPCALGLATPTAIMVGTGLGAKSGILFRNGESLEVLNKIKNIVLDKTGTVTEGQPKVVNWYFDENNEAEIKNIVYSVEKHSEHPLSKAITDFLILSDVQDTEVDNFENIPGRGIKAQVAEKTVFIGNEKLFTENNISLESAQQVITGFKEDGNTLVVVSFDNKISAVIGVKDSLKANSKEAIAGLNKSGIKTFLLSGDNQNNVQQIAKELNVSDYYADVLPSEKTDVVKEIKSKNGLTAMVGDGINDAPALALSDVGIAMGSGTATAIESSDVTLLNNHPEDILKAVKISKITIAGIKQNLFWAFVYNTIGIPLAAFGLLNPMIAALAMSLSSVSVISNSLRIRGKKI